MSEEHACKSLFNQKDGPTSNKKRSAIVTMTDLLGGKREASPAWLRPLQRVPGDIRCRDFRTPSNQCLEVATLTVLVVETSGLRALIVRHLGTQIPEIICSLLLLKTLRFHVMVKLGRQCAFGSS